MARSLLALALIGIFVEYYAIYSFLGNLHGGRFGLRHEEKVESESPASFRTVRPAFSVNPEHTLIGAKGLRSSNRRITIAELERLPGAYGLDIATATHSGRRPVPRASIAECVEPPTVKRRALPRHRGAPLVHLDRPVENLVCPLGAADTRL
jgi:hypothetical protein